MMIIFSKENISKLFNCAKTIQIITILDFEITRLLNPFDMRILYAH
jgi:hypothetical protein